MTADGQRVDRSLEELYRQHYAPMVRLARLLTGSVVIAEDLVQDAFIRLAARLDELDNPVAYLRTIVVNASRSHHRHEAVVQRNAGSRAETVLPQHLVEFEDALLQLPERQRVAIVLRYYLDVPDAESAEMLHCSRSTVRTLIRRGMAHLRKVIEP